MSTVEKHCQRCGDTEHESMGKVPGTLGAGEDESAYYDTYVCTECGSIRTEHPDGDEIQETDRTYVNILVDNGIMTEEEAQELIELWE